MTKVVWLILLLAVVVTVLAAVFKGGGRRGATGDIRLKKLLTDREQPMFFKRQQAWPNEIVHSLVVFSALHTAKHQATRTVGDHKVADIVVKTKAFQALAISTRSGRRNTIGTACRMCAMPDRTGVFGIKAATVTFI
jgi:membrane-associated PAP2 superfamily phosphatase